MKQKIFNLCSKLKIKITHYDLYPKIVNFTCDENDKFKTFFGGIMSVMIRILIFALAVWLIIMIIK